MRVPTRLTCTRSNNFDKIWSNYSGRVTLQDITNLGLSEHQDTICTIKNSRIKRNIQKQIKFHSFKQYLHDVFEDALTSINFPIRTFTLRKKFPYLELFWSEVSLRIQSECGKMQTRITPKLDTFHAVLMTLLRSMLISFRKSWLRLIK